MIAERLTSQLLAGEPARTPEAVAERLLAIQAQDPRGARLAIRARSAGVTAADVDRALTEERSMVVSWLNRGTLHLVRREDHPWLHALTAPTQLTGNARRLRQEGVSEAAAERAVATIVRALGDEGPLTRAVIGERTGLAGQALVHVLHLASLRGLIVRGPVVKGVEQAYVLVHDWLGEPPPVDRDRALTELARRYLRGHAPATDRDLARWAGLPLRDARAGLRLASPLPDPPRAAELPPPRLLGAFDPLLLGWVDRTPITGPHEGRVVSGGLFRAFILAGGRADGLWRLDRGRVVVEPFDHIDPSALDADAAGVQRFLGLSAST